MKKYKVLVIGLALLTISGVATAGQKSGLYVGGSIGNAGLDFKAASVGFNDNDWGYKLFGGYNFGVIPLLDLAVEGSYVDFGKASSAEIFNQSVGITAWDLFGMASFNLGPIGVFGKVGQAWWDSKSSVLSDVLDRTGNSMAYGLGARFQLGSLGFRAEYEYFDIDFVNVGYFSLGASWTF